MGRDKMLLIKLVNFWAQFSVIYSTYKFIFTIH